MFKGDDLVNFAWRGSQKAALSLTVALVLAACGNPSAQEDVVSAKQHLAKNDRRTAFIDIRNALQKEPGLAEARFLLGRLLLEQNDPVGAEVELKKALDGGWSADQIEPLRARALMISGGPDEVLRRYADTRLTDKTAQAALQVVVASAQLSARQPDKAKATATIDAALQANPASVEAQLLKIRLSASNGDVEGSDKALQQLLASHPGDATVWTARGDWLRAAGRADESAEAYRKAIAADPKLEDPRVSLIQYLFAKHDLKAVEEQIPPLRALGPNHLHAPFFSAMLAFERGDGPAARENVLAVLKLAPENPSVLHLAGQVEAQRGALVQAESYLAKAVQIVPERAQPRLALAGVQLRTGDGQKALQTLQPLLTGPATRSDALSLAGQAALNAGDYKAAEGYFARGVELNPADPRSQTSLAMARIGQGRLEQGIAELDAIAAKDDGSVADLSLIAGQLRTNQLDKALVAVARLEGKAGMKATASQLRGQIELRRNQPDAARAAFEAALKADPALLPAAAALANMDSAQGRWADAIKRFEQVVAANPKNVQAHLALVSARERGGAKPDELIAALRAVVKAEPRSPVARTALVEALMRQRQAKPALAAAMEARSAIPEAPEMLELVGRAQLAAGEQQVALNTFRELSSLTPASPTPWVRQAEVHMVARQFDLAVPALQKALTVRPGDVDVQRLLVGAMLTAGQQAEALRMTAQLQRSQPKSPLGFVLEGDIRAATKDWPKAVSAYRGAIERQASTELALKLQRALIAANMKPEAQRFEAQWGAAHPRDSGFPLALADAALTAKDFDTARRHYQRVVDIDPTNALAFNNLGWLMFQAKDARAMQFIQKARAIAPKDPVFMDTEAELRAQSGQMTEALALQQAAVAAAPEQPDFRLNLARLYVTAGKKDEARKELDRLTALGDKFPRQPEVREILKRI